MLDTIRPAGPLGRAVYCMRCGREARLTSVSLDVRHPIVTCRYAGAEGAEVGCGRQPGTFDLAEAHEAIHERRRDRATAHHAEHVRGKRQSADCRACEADPPPSRATIHRYAPITRKYQVAAHLEFSHADRSMLARLALRSPQELIDYHRKLHDDALATP